MNRRPFLLPGIGWLAAISLAAVVLVNAVGILAISGARKGLAEEAARLFDSRTQAEAVSLQGFLSNARADLTFLAGSQPIADLPGGLSSSDPALARFRRLAVEGAVLLFLRAHPEFGTLRIDGPGGQTLVRAGRRGGVPVLWHPGHTDPAESAGASSPPATATATPPASGLSAPAAGSAVSISATLDPRSLLSRVRGAPEGSIACILRDSAGLLLARESEGAADGAVEQGPRRASGTHATATVAAEGWQRPAPWTLECTRASGPAETLEPLATQFRATLWLNLGVLGLTLLLGYFAIDQSRRRERLEDRAREEGRVREMERQLFHSERLGTVGRMAASMAHEINNPLEGVANYLSLVQDAVTRNDAQAAVRYLGRSEEGLRRATEILRRVLQHADPATSPRAPVDLNEALESAVSFVRSSGSFSGIQFSLQLPAPAPRILGDPVTLGQLFLNLVINACEAQPAGGRVSVGCSIAAEGIQVAIADEGPGISPADAERIFEPFFSTKGSTGLGLSICRAIVRQHGGEIRAEPGPAGGASFVMIFPPPALIT